MPVWDLDDQQKEKKFGPSQEKAIISLIFDEPEFFTNVAQYLSPEDFNFVPAQYVYAIVYGYYKDKSVVITRDLCREEVEQQMTADDDFENVFEIINRRSNPREVPIIREKLVEWSKQRAYEKIYSDEAIQAFEAGDFSEITNIVEDARKITDKVSKGFWFFKNLDTLFIENQEQKLTTGFPRLDAIINEGGPTFGDTFCWMAPTGVGKSILMVNNAVSCLRMGLNVVYVTLELSDFKSALRIMGATSEVPIKSRTTMKDMVKRNLEKFYSTYNSELIIYEFAPDDISIDNIYALLDELRRVHDLNPDVVIIDYLELLLSKEPAYNKSGNDYIRQKHVSTEIRQLARKENVLVFTASQTNRSGTAAATSNNGGGGGEVIDLNKVAESYGKTMPLDYIVTINQTRDEYKAGFMVEGDEDSPNTKAICRFFVAKNRNGPKFKTIQARINYETMKVREDDFYD